MITPSITANLAAAYRAINSIELELSGVITPPAPPVVTPPPAPTPLPPTTIDGLAARYYTLGPGRYNGVSQMRNTALVVTLVAPANVVKIYSDAAQLTRMYWRTTDLRATPVWTRGDNVTGVKAGEFIVFRNYKADESLATNVEVGTAY
jgi:hypothetical protein